MSRKNKFIVALLKITNFPDDVRGGNLYCNRIWYYYTSEEKEVGDSREGTAAHIHRPGWNLIFRDSETLTRPVFCLYAVIQKRQGYQGFITLPNDQRLKSFGNKVVIIKDVKTFLDKIKQTHPDFEYNLVRYINFQDPPAIDRYAIFKPIVTKDKYFMYQSEFRIYSDYQTLGDITPKSPSAIPSEIVSQIFKIGDLNDICESYSTSELIEGVAVDLKIDWDFANTKNFYIQLPTNSLQKISVKRREQSRETLDKSGKSHDLWE